MMTLAQSISEKRVLPKVELSKYDYTPLYLYTEKDSLNRITVLKEIGKESYLVAGRYAGTNSSDRLYNPLTEDEKAEIQKLLKIKSRDSAVVYL
jgi:hypothetical protein